MKYEIGDLVTLPNRKLVILDIIKYDKYNVAFCDHVSDDESSVLNKYVVMLLEDGQMSEIENRDFIEVVLPLFNKNIQRDVELYKNFVENN